MVNLDLIELQLLHVQWKAPVKFGCHSTEGPDFRQLYCVRILAVYKRVYENASELLKMQRQRSLIYKT